MLTHEQIRLAGNRLAVQEIRQVTVGSILIPRDPNQGMEGIVLSVGPGALCEDIYPGDRCILRAALASPYRLDGDVWLLSAVDVWGVIRDGEPHPRGVNGSVCVRLDEELPDVDPTSGLWTPTDGREFPSTGWATWEGKDWHVHFDTRRPQRRLRIGQQVYVLIDREHLTGYVEEESAP